MPSCRRRRRYRRHPVPVVPTTSTTPAPSAARRARYVPPILPVASSVPIACVTSIASVAPAVSILTATTATPAPSPSWSTSPPDPSRTGLDHALLQELLAQGRGGCKRTNSMWCIIAAMLHIQKSCLQARVKYLTTLYRAGHQQASSIQCPPLNSCFPPLLADTMSRIVRAEVGCVRVRDTQPGRSDAGNDVASSDGYVHIPRPTRRRIPLPKSSSPPPITSEGEEPEDDEKGEASEGNDSGEECEERAKNNVIEERDWSKTRGSAKETKNASHFLSKKRPLLKKEDIEQPLAKKTSYLMPSSPQSLLKSFAATSVLKGQKDKATEIPSIAAVGIKDSVRYSTSEHERPAEHLSKGYNAQTSCEEVYFEMEGAPCKQMLRGNICSW